MNPVDELFSVLTGPGNDQWYDGDEQVSQIQHALQCATLAEREGATAALITAALLHDVGHLTNQQARKAIDAGLDACHENRAVRYLQQWFGPEVLEPIRLHVAAKRYLICVDPEYLHRLSWGSVRSLEAQGGPMSRTEAEAFAAQPFARDAVRLRTWDDRAKQHDAATPDIEHFRVYVERSLRHLAA